MSECEVCGKDTSGAKKAEIDGVILSVCEDCAKLGKEVYQPKKVFLQPQHSISSAPRAESIESDSELAQDFSSKIRHAREKANLTQDEAADKMNISRQMYKRIEGGFKPDDATAKRIERFYRLELYVK
ncbi:MAG: helix-turn-helix domain-containing protein [Candidatus Aenigmarchaeota archaeon]|nr:helix-turn-helix domain-containing protein [Candidatus Aenigmarchaeota archaeon]